MAVPFYIPQNTAILCGSEPARDGGVSDNANVD